MGRTPTLQNLISDILIEQKKPLRFDEIKQRTENRLGRTDVDIGTPLQGLQKIGKVEKIAIEGKFYYQLSQMFHLQSTKDFIIKTISREDTEDLTKLLDKPLNGAVPSVVFIVPKQANVYEISRKVGMGVDVEWDKPVEGVALTLINDFLMLSPRKQIGIIHLLAWCYWVGVQSSMESYGIGPLKTVISNNRDFAQEIIAKSLKDGDKRRAETEETLVKILDLTSKLISKEDLVSYLDFVEHNNLIIKRELQKILSNEELSLNAGERIFEDITNFGRMTFAGFVEAGLSDGLERNFTKHILDAYDVWNSFISRVLSPPLVTRFGPDIFSSIRGTLQEAVGNVKVYTNFFSDLAEIFRQRRIVAIYLWNCIGLDNEADKSLKLPMFEEWFNALKAGRLDHRAWIFEEEFILKRLEKAFRAVKRNSEPPKLRIDKEYWTLNDLYQIHPRGKEESFWLEIIDEIKKRKNERIDTYKEGPVPKGVYERAMNKERKVVVEALKQEDK